MKLSACLLTIGLAVSLTAAAGQAAVASTVAETVAPELPHSVPTLSPVVEGLDAPWGMDWLPNGDVLVTQNSVRSV